MIEAFDGFGNFESKEDVIAGLKQDPESSIDIILMAMKEACNQAIELCAENARTERVYPDLHPSYEIVDKVSILKTKDQL